MSRFEGTLPIYNELTDNHKEGTFVNKIWAPWFTMLHRNVKHLNNLYNPHLTLNPDFHWSRTKGNTPTTSDGAFVERWDVKSNGMTFSIVPTFYTDTAKSSLTGSQRYVNVAITVPNTNEFDLFQAVLNKISKYQNQKITFSVKINNNNSTPVKAKFYVGFDTNNNGTDDLSATSKTIYIQENVNDIMALVETPAISVDNQNNKVTAKLILFDIGSAVDIDVYFIKPEFAVVNTAIVVDHTLEKVLIDNE